MKIKMKELKETIIHSWKTILAVLIIVILGVILVRGLKESHSVVVSSLPPTMTTGMGEMGDRINLFPGLGGSESLALIPFWATADTDQYVIYCLEKEKGFFDGQTITKQSSSLDSGYVYLMQNGYPAKSFIGTGYESEEEYLTRIAVWWYQDLSAGVADITDGVLTANQKATIKASGWWPFLEPLLTGALNAKNTAIVTPSFSLSVGTLSLSSDGLYLESGYFTLSTNITIDNFQIVTDNPNAEILNTSGGLITGTVTPGTQVKLRIPLENITTTTTNLGIDVIITYTENEVYRYEAIGEAGFQDMLPAAIVPVSKQTILDADIPLPKGSLVINKVDDSTGDPLAGAVIRVTRVATSEVITTFTTTTSPTTVSNLIYGTYTIEEISAPNGFVTSTEVINQTVNTTNIPITISNVPIDIKVLKTDSATGAPVAGARLQILDSSRDIVYDFISTTSPISIPDLDVGTYTIKEVTAPNGYLLNSTEKSFTVSESNSIQTISFTNTKNITTIEKRDASDESILAGAVLKLTNTSTSTVVDTWTTTTSAKTFDGLSPGNYLIEEISAPPGYVTTGATETFTIANTDTIAKTITMYNSKNKLTIVKIDSETNDPLPGAVLRIEDSSGTVVVPNFTTTTTPKEINKIAAGTYYLVEVTAPSGYTLNTTKQRIDIAATDSNIIITMENTENSVSLSKIDEDTLLPVAGASLRLVTSSGTVVDSWTSMVAPHVIRGLATGTYYLEEISAPNGYVKNTGRVRVDITQATDTASYQISNKKIDIKINKVDADTRESLPGVTLQLLDSTRAIVDSWLTTTTPYQLNINEGTYYLIETATIDGYVLDRTEKRIIVDSNNPVQVVEFANQKTKVDIGKIDAKTKNFIAGATLKLSSLDPGFEPVIWTSTTSAKRFVQLPEGTYILEEISAPSGYITSNSKLTFEVRSTGSVQTINLSTEHVILTIDDRILSVDTGGIEGYVFSLEKPNGIVVDTWTSTSSVYETNPLDLGDYVLKELAVPDGMIKNNTPYFFTVTNTTETSEVYFSNDFTKLLVSKTDTSNALEVEGAMLVIKNEAGVIVEKWGSTTEPHLIERLPVGRYTLTEIIAPTGFVLNSNTIEFVIEETGDIQTTGMYNQPVIPNTTSSIPLAIYVIGVILVVGGTLVLTMTIVRKEANVS